MQPLQSMFVSEEWNNSSYAKKPDGKEVKKIVMKDNQFWAAVGYVLKSTQPIVKVLRLVDSEKMPPMGFIYGAMDKAKEEIAKNLGGEEKDYKEIWEIIDEKWDFQLHQHLHAAAYYLNPRIRYSDKPSNHPEIKLGLYHCMNRMFKDPNDLEKADLQLDEFQQKNGFFGLRQAQGSYMKRNPSK